MIINYEFLGNEAIENVVTCMHYKVDKVVFFGFYDTIVKQKKQTEYFLKTHCDVKKVSFVSLSQRDLVSVYSTMEKEIIKDKTSTNLQFFDITGGESLILVAFGMLAKEYKLPTHVFDVVRNMIVELDEGATVSISSMAQKQNVSMSLDMYIKLRGGLIVSSMKEENFRLSDVEFEVDTERIWEELGPYMELWNPFAEVLKSNLNVNDDLKIYGSRAELTEILGKSKNQFDTIEELDAMLAALERAGAVKDINSDADVIDMEFKNGDIRDCVRKSGNLLELHTYRVMKKEFDESMVDVYIDWDGVIHTISEDDVNNEVDMIGIKGVIPTFISCKSGRLSGNTGLHALYELLTIREKFGGKYSRMILAVSQKMSKTNELRAKEMGIEIMELF